MRYWKMGCVTWVSISSVEGGDEGLACFVVHVATGGGAYEVVGSDFAFVDDGQDDGIGDKRPEGLHHVQGQCGAAEPGFVVEPPVGVEADGGQGYEPFPGQHGISEGEHGVDGVLGRAAVSFVEGKAHVGVVRGLEHACEVPEIPRCGGAFDAEQRIDGIGLGGLFDVVVELCQQIVMDAGGVVSGAFEVAAHESAAVGDLGGDPSAGELEAGFVVETGPVLVGPQFDVLVSGADRMADEPTVVGVVGDGDGPFHAFVEQGGGHGGISVENNAGDVGQGDFFPGPSFFPR